MEENTPLNDTNKKEEKWHVFTKHKSRNQEPTIIRVKESELTKWQRDLLLGEVIKRFNDLPEDLKQKFMYQIFEGLKDNIRENPSPMKKALQDAAMKKIEDEINKSDSETKN